MTKKVAVLVDGNFYLRRHYSHFGSERSKNPRKVARDVWIHCMKHIRKKEGEEIYRILFYDCAPILKRIHHPLTNKSVNLAKSDTAVFRQAFFKQLVKQPVVALRLGHLDEDNARWLIRDTKLHTKIITGKQSADGLKEEDYYYHANQKGVDMKIGLDIASLTLKKLVDKIVLIAGDSDFVPAAKLARREGIKFILDPMGNPIREDLSEHIDGLTTTLPVDNGTAATESSE